MAALGSQTIASSYEQLLHVDTDGGGNTTTLVPIKDGDNGTTFCLQIATTSALIEGSGSKLYFSDAGGEYISGNGSILSIAGGNEIDLTATAIDINGTVDISSTLAVGGDVTISASASTKPHLTITNTHGDGSAPQFIMKKDSASPADNDEVGRIYMYGDDDAGNPFESILIRGITTDVSNGSEDSRLEFLTYKAGAQVPTLALDSGFVGIGTIADGSVTVPATALHVSSASNSVITWISTDGNNTKTMHLAQDATRAYLGSSDTSVIQSWTPAGLVGIGTASPAVDFVVSNGGENGIELNAGASASTIGTFNRNTSSYTDLTLETAKLTFAPQSNNRVAINMGSSNNEALAFKASAVAHGRTTYTETDTWLNVKKTSNASGGAQLIANMEDASVGYVLSLTASGGEADTTKSGSAHGLVKIWSEEHNGSNGIANITANGNIFAVSGYIGSANTTVFLVDEDGDIHYDGSDAGAYDYAEMFEWEDGNPDNEDRVGYSVSLVGEKIKKAEEGETVVGIVSAVPAVCGDSPMEWQKRYKTDEWGRKIHKEVDCVKFEIQHETEPIQYYDEDDSETKDILYERNDELPEGKKVGDVKEVASKKVGDVKKEAVVIAKEKHYEGDAIPSELPDDAVTYKKLISQNSDEYDSDQEYIPRKERKEWSPVGLVGKLRMRKGQLTASSWIKMKDEGNNIEMWFVK